MYHVTRFPHRRTALALLALLALVWGGCSRHRQVARLLEQGSQRFEAGDLEQAEIHYKNALQKDPQNADAISHLGQLYQLQGRDGRAAVFLLKARDLQPDNVTVRLKLGLARLAAQQFKDAREDALFVLERKPDDEQAPMLLVEASTSAAEVENARQRLLQLPPAAAQAAPALIASGQVALRQNRLADAQAAFKEAVARAPRLASAHSALAILLWSQKDLAGADAAFKQSAELSPPRSPRRLQYVQFKLRTGDVAGARQVLEQMTRATPDYLPAWTSLAEIALAENKPDAADTYVTRALAREPLDAEALMLSARVRLAKGEPAKAVSELERMLTFFPRSVTVSYQLALAHAANNDPTKALAQLTQVVAAAPDMTAAIVSMGEIHLRRRDYTAAIATLKPVAQKHPELVGARIGLAEAYRGQGSLDEAVAVYTSLRMEFPGDARFAFARGTILLQQNKRAEAQAEFVRTRELDPGHIAALEQLVQMDLADRQPAMARARLEPALAKNPDAPTLLMLRAQICLAQSDTNGAEAALKKIIEVQPDSARAQYLLARLYVGMNQQEKAIANLRDSTRQNPRNLASHLLLGVLLDERKDYAGACAAYETALAIQPKSSLALNNLAYLYTQRFGRTDDALALAQRARALLPQEPRTADTLGWVLTRKKQYAAAATLLEESAAKLPDEPEVQYHLGVAEYMSADEPAARTALQRALELNPALSSAADARQRLAILAIDPAHAGPADRTALEQRTKEESDDPVALLRLAELARRSGDNDQALARYQAILAGNPRHAIALLNVARIQAARHDLAKAMEAGKAARNAAPGNPEILHTVGRIAFDSGDYRWSASLLQEASRLRPDDADVQFDWAEAAYAVGRVTEAEAGMRHALEVSPAFTRAATARQFVDLLSLAANPGGPAGTTKPEQALNSDATRGPALMAMGAAAEQRGDVTAARKHYETLLTRLPDFSPAQKRLTILYAAAATDGDKAAQLANKARQAFPDDVELARAAGIIAYRQGEFAKALSLLQEPASKTTQDGEILYYVGMAQSRLNKRDEGRKSLRRALEVGLHGALATEAKKSLASTP